MMAINIVNSDILTLIDHNIEKQLDFFITDLKQYLEYHLKAIDKSAYCLIIPKFIGFETGERAWRYEKKWKITDQALEENPDWVVIRCEVLDAKTV